MVNERSVIDVERDFTNEGQRVFAVLVVENPYIFRNEAAKRIQRQPANGSFDTALVQLLDDAIAPLPAEASFPQIPAAAEKCQESEKNGQTQEVNRQATRERGLSILRWCGNFGGFEQGH